MTERSEPVLEQRVFGLNPPIALCTYLKNTAILYAIKAYFEVNISIHR